LKLRNDPIYLGEDNISVERPVVRDGVKEGTRDAIATMTKYAVIGGAVFIIGSIFVPPRIINSLQRKYL